MKRTLQRIVPLILATATAVAPAFASPEIPGADQTAPIALVGATLHPVSGPAIEQGTIVFDRGRITAIGRDVEIPDGAERIEIRDRHVYPGLLNAYGNMGLVEISMIRATRDIQEAGSFNPNIRAEVAVNPDSELIPVTRSGGVLLALSAPAGGVVAGTSAVLQLDGWTWEDMTLRTPIGMHIQWPPMTPVVDWWVRESAEEQLKKRDEALVLLEKTFAEARAYQKARAANGEKQLRDTRYEAMIPVIEGKLPLIVAADEIQQIQAAVTFAERHGVRMILLGGYDAPLCVALLKKHAVPVIISGVHRLPLRRSDDYDAPFTLPERLRAAGLTFCIAGGGRFADSNSRNLPYHAATAAGHGLPKEEALRAITLYPAQILGVADRVGSLEVGKDATLILTDGDPLETPTQVHAAYIQGRAVDLSDRHQRLWKKYQEKYRRLEAAPKASHGTK